MFITVEDFDDNLVFKGEADDFLFQNDNDIELETILEKLEYKNFGESVLVKNNNERYIITKIDELI